MTAIPLPRGANLNTLVTIVGFLSLFATVIAAWTNLQNEQRNFGAFIEDQKQFNGRVEERFRAGSEKLAQIPVIQNDVTRIEATADKTNNLQDDRISRLADSNSKQLSDLNAGLSNLTTQVALVKQSLDRIEASWTAPAAAVAPTDRRRVN